MAEIRCRCDRKLQTWWALGCVAAVAALFGIALLMSPVQTPRGPSAHGYELNNLKQLSVALLHFSETYGGIFPQSAFFVSPEGKPLLSWRVAILPYIDHDGLYKEFHFDEPWDSPHNIQLLEKMPRAFRDPWSNTQDGRTRIKAVTGKGAAFESRWVKGSFPKGEVVPLGGLRKEQIIDGLDKTIFLVVAADPVEWTRPEDFDLAPPISPRLRFKNGKTPVAFGDGNIKELDPRSEAKWHALMTAAGGEAVDPD
jgi:hypothetical protein